VIILESLTLVLIISQIIFTFIAGAYFFSNFKSQSSAKSSVCADSKEELEKLKALRKVKLPEPLSEITRPKKIEDIAGQESGIKALRNAICSPSPQHVIIYGPPGVGKTAAARIILEEAKENPLSPFSKNSPFIELDATILQFDERSIADPLMGSVHDPIYHGAGSYGQAGVPQPKPGAVTNAHGGILFIDEIGELHNSQLNKLLKVLEDRKVILSSSYYSKSNKNIPKHVHDIFNNGFPADFRLIGATTKKPEDIPPALRSRCKEVFFKPLNKAHLETILKNTTVKANLECEEDVYNAILNICENGRDIVNIVQSLESQAIMENRNILKLSDVKDIVSSGSSLSNSEKYKEKYSVRIGIVSTPVIDYYGKAIMVEIETAAVKNISGMPQISINGIAETEEIVLNNRRLLRKSAAAASVYNALATLKNIHSLDYNDYDIFINFSSYDFIFNQAVSCAVFCALYSSIMNLAMAADISITGDISINGAIKPVENISEKIIAASDAGCGTVLIPQMNIAESDHINELDIVGIKNSEELIKHVFTKNRIEKINDSGPSLKIIHAFPPNNR